MNDAVTIRRLGATDSAIAHAMFSMMAEVFEEPCARLSDAYVVNLLAEASFWALAALADDEVVAGITAHVLPMTRTQSREIFIYDIAVRDDRQRRGIGRQLVTHLLDQAAAEGIAVAFVAAENVDEHALAFYRALGGSAVPATFYSFER